MAGGYSPFPSTSDASQRTQKLSQGKNQPTLPPRTVSGYTQRIDNWRSERFQPRHGDPNLDPFYLERVLGDTRISDSYGQDDRDVGFDQRHNEYFMSSDVKSDRQPTPVHFHKDSVSFPSTGYQPVTPKFEFDHDLAHFQYPAPKFHRAPLHCSQISCSTMQTDATGFTPDLTPSSSFSSAYSVPNCPEAVLKATEQLCLNSNRVRPGRSDSTGRFYLPAATPPATPHNQSWLTTRPTTPTETTTPYVGPVNASSDTLIMPVGDNPASSTTSLRVKHHPSLPELKRNPSAPKKWNNQSSRTQIDTSIISPPCLINPVTLEPHASHLNHVFFIPDDDYPSPVPSPVLTSPPITREITAQSSSGRPSTSNLGAHCEQSVWESDSDTESVASKSLSRRGPMETLRKVRSRVQLRVTKCGTRLNEAAYDVPAPGEFPTVPKNPLIRSSPEAKDTKRIVCANPSPKVPRTAAQTPRFVVPSTTSLPYPQSRHPSEEDSCNIDTSTAAAIQAQTRRRQQSNRLEEFPSIDTEEKNENNCLASHSDLDRHSSLSPDRGGTLRRIWVALRALNCTTNGTNEDPRTKSA